MDVTSRKKNKLLYLLYSLSLSHSLSLSVCLSLARSLSLSLSMRKATSKGSAPVTSERQTSLCR